MFPRLDYSRALEYSIIRRYTNIVYYYYVSTIKSYFRFTKMEEALHNDIVRNIHTVQVNNNRSKLNYFRTSL